MEVLISSLALLGYCLLLRRFTRLPIEASPLLVISTIILLLYIFAYADHLKSGTLLLISIGSFACILSPVYLLKNRVTIFTTYFTPGFSIFIFFVVIYGWLALFTAETRFGDDIRRWMPHAKLLYENHGFIKGSDSITNADYPPGGALFYYWFLRTSAFTESKLFLAQVFLIFSPLLIFLRCYRWSELTLAFVIFSGLILVLLHPFEVQLGARASVMMDNPMGLFFGGILATYYLLENESKRWFYLLFPAIAMFLFRPMAYPFIAIATTIILTDQYLTKNQSANYPFSLLAYTGLLIAPLIVSISWQHYLNDQGMNNTWTYHNLFNSMVHHQKLLSQKQFHHVLLQFIHSSILSLNFIILMFIFVAVICRYTSNSLLKKRIWSAHIILLLGFVGYQIFLLLFYLYQIDILASITLSSYRRFKYTYEIGWLLIFLAHVFYILSQNKIPLFPKRIQNRATYIFAFILVLFLAKDVFVQIHGNNKHMVKQEGWRYLRAKINPIAIAIKNITGNAKRGIIGNDLSPFFLYQFIPDRSLSFYGKLNEIDKFAAAIKQLDYVVITDTDGQFRQHYAAYFSIAEAKPFATLKFCKSFVPPLKGCEISETSIYLYKINVKDNKITLTNLVA